MISECAAFLIVSVLIGNIVVYINSNSFVQDIHEKKFVDMIVDIPSQIRFDDLKKNLIIF